MEGSLVLHQQKFPYNGAFAVQMHFLLKKSQNAKYKNSCARKKY